MTLSNVVGAAWITNFVQGPGTQEQWQQQLDAFHEVLFPLDVALGASGGPASDLRVPERAPAQWDVFAAAEWRASHGGGS